MLQISSVEVGGMQKIIL